MKDSALDPEVKLPTATSARLDAPSDKAAAGETQVVALVDQPEVAAAEQVIIQEDPCPAPAVDQPPIMAVLEQQAPGIPQDTAGAEPLSPATVLAELPAKVSTPCPEPAPLTVDPPLPSTADVLEQQGAASAKPDSASELIEAPAAVSSLKETSQPPKTEDASEQLGASEPCEPPAPLAPTPVAPKQAAAETKPKQQGKKKKGNKRGH